MFEIPFNVGHDQAAAKWNRDVTKLVTGLFGYKHVIIFVTTHSHPDNGDLWLGLDERNESVAATVTNVSTNLFITVILTVNSTVA